MSKRARRARGAPAAAPLPDEDALRERVELAGLEVPQQESIGVGPTLGGSEPSAAGAQVTATAGDAPLRQASLWGDAWRQLRRNPLFIIPAVFLVVFTLMAFWPSLFANGDPRDCDLSRSILPPSRENLFGFDVQGCDYYTRVIYGTHVSLTIGLLTVLSAATIAITLGSISGYYGGKVDAVVARIADIWFAIPLVLGGIIILNFLGDRGLFLVSLALMVLTWPTMMRLMRSSVLSVKEMDYVQAARALGASDFRILRTHILPNGIAPVIVYGTITVGIVIAVEATLSFLGVGLQLPSISWGLMISGAQARILASPHLLFFPALFLIALVFTFILLGDALRDALDPRLH